MLKIAGCILVFFSCFTIGMGFKKRKCQRIFELENLISCMNILENEMRYSMSDIEKSFVKMAETASIQNKNIFLSCCEILNHSNGTTLSSIWNEVLSKYKNNSCYTKEDINLILEFGNVLGAGDVETQLKNIEFFKINLSNNIETAKAKFQKNGDLSLKMGIYIGALIVIFFI